MRAVERLVHRAINNLLGSQVEFSNDLNINELLLPEHTVFDLVQEVEDIISNGFELLDSEVETITTTGDLIVIIET